MKQIDDRGRNRFQVRQIPVTFENDTRRERNVTLTMGSFTTESGQQLGWGRMLPPGERCTR